MLGKPKFEDLEPELQALLRTVTADDHVVYMAAKAHFDDKRKQARVDVDLHLSPLTSCTDILLVVGC